MCKSWGSAIADTSNDRMKALLFTLIRAFEFDLAVPAKDIAKKTSVVLRPVLLTAEGKHENQMPLLVRPVGGN